MGPTRPARRRATTARRAASLPGGSDRAGRAVVCGSVPDARHVQERPAGPEGHRSTGEDA